MNGGASSPIPIESDFTSSKATFSSHNDAYKHTDFYRLNARDTNSNSQNDGSAVIPRGLFANPENTIPSPLESAQAGASNHLDPSPLPSTSQDPLPAGSQATSASDSSSEDETDLQAVADEIRKLPVGKFVVQCPVLLSLPVGFGYVGLRCPICHANSSSRDRAYFKALRGIWTHMKKNHERDVLHSLGQEAKLVKDTTSTEAYQHMLAFGVYRRYTEDEGTAIKQNPNLIGKVLAHGVPAPLGISTLRVRRAEDISPHIHGTTSSLPHDPNEQAFVPDLFHLEACPIIVRDKDQWFKLSCYVCNAFTDNDGQVFSSLGSFRQHVLANHGLQTAPRTSAFGNELKAGELSVPKFGEFNQENCLAIQGRLVRSSTSLAMRKWQMMANG